MDFLTLEDAADRWSRNVGTEDQRCVRSQKSVDLCQPASYFGTAEPWAVITTFRKTFCLNTACRVMCVDLRKAWIFVNHHHILVPYSRGL
jgi:hypothetical protein